MKCIKRLPQSGGWTGFKNFEVVDKVKESEVITSFYVKAQDGQPVPTYKPGQYITVRVHIPGEKYALNRQYSLSCAPGHRLFLESPSKKKLDFEPKEKFRITSYDHLSVGSLVEISAPAGDFILNLEETAPVALISGGVGLTPMLSMIETLAKANY